jgi:hypothetical protein
MILQFTDSYVDEINFGMKMIAEIQSRIAHHEPFMGSNQHLDRMYSISIVISGIIDHLLHDDNSEPKDNEKLLMCLRSLNNSNICGPAILPLFDMRNIHNLTPVPPVEPVFTQFN